MDKITQVFQVLFFVSNNPAQFNPYLTNFRILIYIKLQLSLFLSREMKDEVLHRRMILFHFDLQTDLQNWCSVKFLHEYGLEVALNK